MRGIVHRVNGPEGRALAFGSAGLVHGERAVGEGPDRDEHGPGGGGRRDVCDKAPLEIAPGAKRQPRQWRRLRHGGQRFCLRPGAGRRDAHGAVAVGGDDGERAGGAGVEEQVGELEGEQVGTGGLVEERGGASHRDVGAIDVRGGSRRNLGGGESGDLGGRAGVADPLQDAPASFEPEVCGLGIARGLEDESGDAIALGYELERRRRMAERGRLERFGRGDKVTIACCRLSAEQPQAHH